MASVPTAVPAAITGSGGLAAAAVPTTAAAAATTVYVQRRRQRDELLAPPSDPFAPLTEFLERMVNDGVIPFITVRLDRGGETVYEHAYGVFTTPEAEEVAFSADTIARFFSMTKPITSAAVLVLWEQLEKFDLDQPISTWIPEWDDLRIRVLSPAAAEANAAAQQLADLVTEPARRPITTRDLLTHSAGLSYGFWPSTISPTARFLAEAELQLPLPISDDPPEKRKVGAEHPRDLRAFCTRLQDIPLVAHPGDEFHYSCATDVLGRLVECLDPEGRSLADFFADVFFKPLGMIDTAFTVGADKLARLAPCFRAFTGSGGGGGGGGGAPGQPPEGDGHVHMLSPAGNVCQFKLASAYNLGEVSQVSPWHADSTNTFKSRQAYSGGGGLLSTVNDYIKFAHMLHTGRTEAGDQILRPDTLEMMREDNLAPRAIVKKNLASYFDGFGAKPTTGWLVWCAAYLLLGLGVSCVIREDPETGKPVKSLENPGGRHATQGTGGWSGAALTNFFIRPDPADPVTLVMATQLLYLGSPLESPVYTLRQTIAKLALDGLFGGGAADVQSVAEGLKVLI